MSKTPLPSDPEPSKKKANKPKLPSASSASSAKPAKHSKNPAKKPAPVREAKKKANKERLKPKQKLDKAREILDVASRAGAGANGEVAVVPANKTVGQALEDHISIDYAIGILKEQMMAETEFYDLTARKLIKRPDGKTRLAAVELYLAYKEGRPVERKIIEHHNLESMDDIKKKLASSPAMCEAFMKMILEAQAQREAKV